MLLIIVYIIIIYLYLNGFYKINQKFYYKRIWINKLQLIWFMEELYLKIKILKIIQYIRNNLI